MLSVAAAEEICGHAAGGAVPSEVEGLVTERTTPEAFLGGQHV